MKLNLMAFLAMAIFVLTACQPAKENNTTVPANLNGDCVNNPSLCQNGIYQQNQGFAPYGGYGYTSPYGINGYPSGIGSSYYYNNYNAGSNPFYYMNNSAYLCNCPAGSIPTYNTYSGLGCVQNNFAFGGYGYAYFSWNAGYTTGANNNHWTNIPQISNLSGHSNSSCYNGVVQSCLVDQVNSCSAGYTCRANVASSRLGLCVSNTTNGIPQGPR